MFKLKPTHYFVMLISALVLSVVYLNFIFNEGFSGISVAMEPTGALSAIPTILLPANYTAIITIALLVAGYFFWVWCTSDDLKQKHRRRPKKKR